MNQPLLPLELQIVACATLLVFSGWVLYLVRFRHLSLRESFLWLLSTAIVLVFALFPWLLQKLARAIGVQVPSNALFALAILYLAVNVLSLTIALSNASTRTRRVAQECALLRAELEDVRSRVHAIVAPARELGERS
jgi:hypothetical protein